MPSTYPDVRRTLVRIEAARAPDIPWSPYVRFRRLPATDTKGTRILVEAYDPAGRRVHRYYLPWRYDLGYHEYCYAIARALLGHPTVRFEADSWLYFSCRLQEQH